ncbi:hypothetical protein ACQP25_22625 [Microtetraspora malaysiensis]|uniref:hypothetical protein n=1 Tax=Microtetraspora malaysiensis TaxID=161358 RepID=UPI003D8D7B05
MRSFRRIAAVVIAAAALALPAQAALADTAHEPVKLGSGMPAQAADVTTAPDSAHSFCVAGAEDLGKVKCYATREAVATARAAQTIYGEVVFDKFGGGQFTVWARSACSAGERQSVNLATWDNNTASRGIMTDIQGPGACRRWNGYELPGCSGTWLGGGTPGVWVNVGINRMMCVQFLT